MSASAAAGAIAAWKGVNAWREQLVGKNDYDLAKRLLTLSFEYQGIINRIRNPFEGEPQLWDKLGEVGAKIDTAYLEARAHWGDGFLRHKKAIKDCAIELRNARKKRDRMQHDQQLKDEQREKIIEETSPILDSLQDDDKDAFSQKVKSAIDNLAAELQPYLKRQLSSK